MYKKGKAKSDHLSSRIRRKWMCAFFFCLSLSSRRFYRFYNPLFFFALESVHMKWHARIEPSMCVLTVNLDGRMSPHYPIHTRIFFFSIWNKKIKKKRKSSHYQLDDVLTFFFEKTRQRQQGLETISTSSQVNGEERENERERERKNGKRERDTLTLSVGSLVVSVTFPSRLFFYFYFLLARCNFFYFLL
jgi:hypothetical protein